MPSASPLPSLFETLAGVCKFIAVSRITPEFFQKHMPPIEFTCAFLRIVANEYPTMEKAFRNALPLSLKEGAVGIKEAMSRIEFTESQERWFDAQSTEVLKVLLLVVRDTDLPGWLSESRWAVEGAFEPR